MRYRRPGRSRCWRKWWGSSSVRRNISGDNHKTQPMASRRGFLTQGGKALFGVGLMGGIPAFMAEAAASNKLIAPYRRRRVLVCIFQRGAMDGLMAVTPFSDTYLQAARPT